MYELLAPAKNLDCGLAAINCGADAVYIGAPQFGAREAAGNTIADIEALTQYAHRYWARVYVALNTLLKDEELPEALRIIRQVYEAGVDGLIIQDVGLLECELPPVPLIASTQMHNAAPERVAFLEQIGFQRAILARELTLKEIKAIHKAAPGIELECFVHGALCVSYSGQCYLSYALGGRSGNRGACAQPCRKSYELMSGNRRIGGAKHYLSLSDLSLEHDLEALIDAGVTSFKIEGRLKDAMYVKNVVAQFRQRLDGILSKRQATKTSSGDARPDFVPDISKTFNRNFSRYFLHGRSGKIGSIRTPKMVGEKIGCVKAILRNGIRIETQAQLAAGDGICFFDSQGLLSGTNINDVQDDMIVVEKMAGLKVGLVLYRNHDHQFLSMLKRSRPERSISVTLTLRAVEGGCVLEAVDEDGNRAEVRLPITLQPADQPELALANLDKQLKKSGQTEFRVTNVHVHFSQPYFIQASRINALRRDVLERLREVREINRPLARRVMEPNDAPFPEQELSFEGNVLNKKAEAFYRRHGAERIEPAAESGLNLRGRKVMTTRYCLKEETDLCPKKNKPAHVEEPLSLVDEEGNRLELRFDCRKCQMEVYLIDPQALP